MIKKQKGFSLLELLVVIAIIGILMGILFTGWGYISRKQASQKAKLELVGLKNAVNEYLADFGEYPNCPKGICTPGETLFMSLAGFHNENGGLELPPYPSKFPPIFLILIYRLLIKLKSLIFPMVAGSRYSFGLLRRSAKILPF